ncbi:hypothetical protein PFLuk1_03819 [Pseudomonas fluorescens]|nr:hypothetical protein PFLuk1_03819 [Pseudomonas fluorescens]
MHLSPHHTLDEQSFSRAIEPCIFTNIAIIDNHPASPCHADSNLFQIPVCVKSTTYILRRSIDVIHPFDFERNSSVCFQGYKATPLIAKDLKIDPFN